jgi:hypothetical protein
MPPFKERHILIIILIIISVATLFCLLGIAIPGWGGYSIFSHSLRSTSTVALCIISLLLLIACIVVAAIILLGVVQHVHLPLGFVLLLIISSLFTLGAFTSVYPSTFHSYNLIVTAFTLTYLSSILATYWLYGARGTGQKSVAPARQQESNTY